MKIAVLSPVAWRTPPRKYGPWEQVASNLTEALVELGHKVTLFATADSVTGAQLQSVCPVGYAEDSEADPKVQEILHISNLMIRANEYDIIHNHFDFLPLAFTPLIKTPVVTTIHGFSSPKIIPVYRRFAEFNSYVSISYSDRSPSLDYAANVYNGLDIDDFPFKPDAKDYLLFFGRIHPDKGTLEAIEIAQKAGRQLIISGLVQDQEYFDQQIRPKIDEESIVYVGNSGPKRRQELLGDAFALLHPISFEEPFGLSVAESMICGTPVIAFNRGSMPELVNPGTSGFLVNQIDEAVDALKDIPGISRNGCRQWAVSKFSRERMVDDYLLVYRNILGI